MRMWFTATCSIFRYLFLSMYCKSIFLFYFLLQCSYLSSAVFSFNTDQSFELIFYISLWSLSFFFLTHTQGHMAFCVSKNPKHVIGPRDRSQTTLTKVWLLHIYHLPPCVDIFYGINVDKMCTFLNHLLTLSCKRSLWKTPT